MIDIYLVQAKSFYKSLEDGAVFIITYSFIVSFVHHIFVLTTDFND